MKNKKLSFYIIIFCITIIPIVIWGWMKGNTTSYLEQYDTYVISRFQYAEYPNLICKEFLGESGYINSSNEENDLKKEGYSKNYAFSNIERIVNKGKTVELPEKTINALFGCYAFNTALLQAGSIDKISDELKEIEYPSTHGRVEIISYTLVKEDAHPIDKLQYPIIVINGESGMKYFKILSDKEERKLEQYPNMQNRYPNAFMEVMGTEDWYSFNTNEQDSYWRKVNGAWDLFIPELDN